MAQQSSPRADQLRAMREAKYARMQEIGRLRRAGTVAPSHERVMEIADRAMTPPPPLSVPKKVEPRPQPKVTLAQVAKALKASEEAAKRRDKEQLELAKKRRAARRRRK